MSRNQPPDSGYTIDSCETLRKQSLSYKTTQRSGSCRSTRLRGFSILELMIVLALSTILATIAVVLYQDYVETARLGVLDASISSIAPFQEAHRIEHGSYGEGSWHLNSDIDESLFDVIGWRPSATDTADFSLEVTLIDNGFRVVARNAFGQAVCRDYPSRETCEA